MPSDNRVDGYIYLDEGDRVLITTETGKEYGATVSGAASGVATVVIDSDMGYASNLRSLSKEPPPSVRRVLFQAFRAGMTRSHTTSSGARVYRLGGMIVTINRGFAVGDGKL